MWENAGESNRSELGEMKKGSEIRMFLKLIQPDFMDTASFLEYFYTLCPLIFSSEVKIILANLKLQRVYFLNENTINYLIFQRSTKRFSKYKR